MGEWSDPHVMVSLVLYIISLCDEFEAKGGDVVCSHCMRSQKEVEI